MKKWNNCKNMKIQSMEQSESSLQVPKDLEVFCFKSERVPWRILTKNPFMYLIFTG